MTDGNNCARLPSLLHTWLQKMEESPEGLPPGLARRAKAAVAEQLREEEREARERAEELSRVAATLEELSPKEPETDA
jgi:transposase-like protein